MFIGQKIFTFNFKDSGNSCDVYVDLNKIRRPGLQSFDVLWDWLPPSRKDQKIWAKKYLPEVSKKIAELLQKKVGVLAVNASRELVVIDPGQGSSANPGSEGSA